MVRTAYPAFQDSVARHADRVAIRDEDVTITYAELERLSRRAGKALIALGIEKGDRIAIWSINRWQWIVAGLGLQAAGGVLVPCGTRLRGPEVAVNLDHSGACLLFTDAGFGDYDFVAAIEEQNLPALERIVVFDDRPATGKVMGWDAFLSLGDDVPDAVLDAAIAAVEPSDLSDILFTSGTTGVPKGVPMEHQQSLIACETQQQDIANFVPGDVFAVTFPFAHNAGYRAGWQASLLYGVTIIPVRNYDALSFLKMIHDERVTMLPAAPTIYQAILDHPDRASYDLSSIRSAQTGGTTVPMRLVERMMDLVGKEAVFTGYGLTESAGSGSCTRSGDPARYVVETAGRAHSTISLRIVDANHQEVPQGETGEIALKGPQIMRGYYNAPEATAAAFTSDGYLLTGDVGCIDADGNVRITDRLKDMYIVGGFNAYPAEIEQILCKLPAVQQAAVIGVDDERLGQVGRAFIIAEPGSSVAEDEIFAFCRSNLANYKVPRSIRFVQTLPLNPTGKIDKKLLREMA